MLFGCKRFKCIPVPAILAGRGTEHGMRIPSVNVYFEKRSRSQTNSNLGVVFTIKM